MTDAPMPGSGGYPDPIPARMRKSITVYEAAKALIAYITPEFEDIARISICPYNMLTGGGGEGGEQEGWEEGEEGREQAGARREGCGSTRGGAQAGEGGGAEV
jgi:hypothetical protein